MAFLVRAGLATGFLRGEMIGVGAASLLMLIFPFVVIPIGPLAILIVAALIGKRTLLELRPNAMRRLAPA